MTKAHMTLQFNFTADEAVVADWVKKFDPTLSGAVMEDNMLEVFQQFLAFYTNEQALGVDHLLTLEGVDQFSAEEDVEYWDEPNAALNPVGTPLGYFEDEEEFDPTVIAEYYDMEDDDEFPDEFFDRYGNPIDDDDFFTIFTK